MLTVTKAESLPQSENWIREKCNIDIKQNEPDSEESESETEVKEAKDTVVGDVSTKKGQNLNRESAAEHKNLKRMEVPVLDSVSPAKKSKVS